MTDERLREITNILITVKYAFAMLTKHNVNYEKKNIYIYLHVKL